MDSGTLDNGISSDGTHRISYLPLSDEGIQYLKMMIIAFKNRLTFKIGTSLTNKTDNSIVWAGIPHKTSTNGGPFGLPDSNYFNLLKEELSLRGIKKSHINNVDIDFLVNNYVLV